MAETREKWDCHILSKPDSWMVWRCNDVLCVRFYFLFRTNGKKGPLAGNGFRHCYGNTFQSAILKIVWSKLCLKFLPKNYDAHWQQQFERYLLVKDFTNIGQDMCQFFHQDLSRHHEMKITEDAWKVISFINIRVFTSKNIPPK